ncbi:NADP-dependent oxidoreductase [Streptomyces sp. NA04227]|uniref:NADP-dependent oxidoreductase n=1 Tax=Streptomyces sp. NA04227 TaxID=2742136 RepID=UPI00159170AA|nr:NADP-dependent oxidoreductase [Streptomyces sp. NA04227]QKW05415.1 NADP-dependent oxidoreductase [Streptomyces sp. NA04227]
MIVGSAGPSRGIMRAALHARWGDPLTVVDAPLPEPAAGEVRLAVRAAGINPIDVFTGRNAGYEQSMELPFVPGWDVAGVVDAVGYGVTRHSAGDRLFGLARFPYPAGAYAQFVTVPAFHLVPMPSTASFPEAGALPMAALTARQMLDAARVGPGTQVIVSGASGGVGHLAVQLAVVRGATVTALARPRYHAPLYELGATRCVDHTDPAAVAGAGPADAVIDLVGHDFGRSLFALLRPGGTVALASAWSVPGYRDEALRCDIRAVSCLVEPDPEGLREIAALMDTGRLRVVVGARFPLAEAAEAQQWLWQRRGLGKAVIVTEVSEDA